MCVLKNISPYNIIKRKKIRQNYPSPLPASTHVFVFCQEIISCSCSILFTPSSLYKSLEQPILRSFRFFFLFFSFHFSLSLLFFFLNYQILHTNFNHTNRALNQRDQSLSIISRMLLIRYFYIRVPLPGSLVRSLSSLGNEVKQTTFSSSNLVE